MTRPTRFNLLDEPWIAALGTDGSEFTLSLRDAFVRAHYVRRLSGELPTQDVAILRLMLAILYRSIEFDGDDVDAAELWSEWWSDGNIPQEHLTAYLEKWEHRFDLLDSERPFLQVADLHTTKGGTSGLRKIIADLPAGHQYFTNRAGEGATSLSLAEAARWLVHCQAFDVSGIKSGAVGDPRVKGGKGYPIGTGWTGNLGLVVVEGATLLQTLLLNLVLTSPSIDEDEPVWEWEAVGSEPNGLESPWGPVQSMVWQARRVRLHVAHDGKVTDVLIANGDQIRVRNQHNREPMSAWRRSTPQEKKHGEPVVYMPQEHRMGVAVWRGLGPLLAAPSVTGGSGTGESHLRPTNVQWVGSLRDYRALPHEALVVLHTVGIVYGSQSAVVDTILDDRLALHSTVLADRDLQDAAVRAAKMAEGAARTIGRLAREIAEAEGRDDSSDYDAAATDSLQRFDPKFRLWALRLGGEPLPDLEDEWRSQLRAAAEASASELYQSASSAALRGRTVTDSRNDREYRIDAARAHRTFLHRLSEVIPSTGPRAVTDQEQE